MYFLQIAVSSAAALFSTRGKKDNYVGEGTMGSPAMQQTHLCRLVTYF